MSNVNFIPTSVLWAKANIVIPVYNDSERLQQLLNSLKQNGVPGTIVQVVDAGSDKAFGLLNKDYNVQLHRINNKVSPSQARNIGAKLTHSDTLIFLDSDIIVTKSWVERVLKLLETDFFELTGQTYDLSLSPSWIEKYWFKELLNFEKDYVNGGNIIVKRFVFDSLDGFDESLPTGEDVDFSYRAKKNGYKVDLDKFLKVHHEGNPQTFREFIGREKWHGMGDLRSFSDALKSKITLISLFFLCMTLSTLLAFIFSKYTLMLYALGLTYLATMTMVLVKFRKISISLLTITLFIFWGYLIGRSLSVFDRIMQRS